MTTLPQGMTIEADVSPEFAEILTPEALAFVAKLSRAFEPRRKQLLAARVERSKRLDAGERPDFLAGHQGTSATATGGSRRCRPRSHRRRVRDHRAGRGQDGHQRLQLGRRFSYMTDFEDSQRAVVVRTRSRARSTSKPCGAPRRWSFEQSVGRRAPRRTSFNDTIATLQVRPRGWHLDEKHVTDRRRARSRAASSTSRLFTFHNAKEQLARGAGPVLLPAQARESHLEARLWNDIFVDDAESRARPASGARSRRRC